MKLKLKFSADSIDEIYTAEQNKDIIEESLKELCSSEAEINVHSVELTRVI